MFDALFTNGAAWFTVPALLGTFIFIIKLLFMLGGGADDLDLGGDVSSGSVGLDGGVDAGGHGGGLAAIATVQGASAFMMGFGWAGLGAFQGFQLGMLASMGVGLVGAMAMSGLFVALLSTTRKLHSSGNIDFSHAKGTEGEVYATIPAGGQSRGQVRIVISGRQRIVQATSSGGAIPTGTRVRVVATHADNSVVVERAGPA